MFAWKKNQNIAIWGTGKKAKRLYYLLREYYQVVAFIDNTKKSDTLFQLPIIEAQDIEVSKYKIVIGSNYYEEIEKQCLTMHLFLYDDYLPYYMVSYEELYIEDIWKYAKPERRVEIMELLSQEKKIAYIHGNCQIDIEKQYLKCNPEFNETYIFLHIPAVHLNKNVELLFDNMNTLSSVKLFITQCISENNEIDFRFGTHYLKQQFLKYAPDVKIVTIPNLFFDVYFPQAGKMPNRFNVLVNELDAGVFPYPDYLLDDLARKYSKTDILQIVSCEELYSKEYMQKYQQERFTGLLKREAECDIKIVDYIQKNYKKEQIFYSRNHPTNKLIKEMMIRLLKYLHMSTEIQKESTIDTLKQWQEFIYPSVYKSLDLQFFREFYSDGDSAEVNTFETEIARYLNYCHLL